MNSWGILGTVCHLWSGGIWPCVPLSLGGITLYNIALEIPSVHPVGLPGETLQVVGRAHVEDADNMAYALSGNPLALFHAHAEPLLASLAVVALIPGFESNLPHSPMPAVGTGDGVGGGLV